MPAMEEKNLEEKPIYLHTIPYVKVSPYDRVGLRTAKYKYFRNNDDPKQDVHLYDLDLDPKENNNIAKENPDVVNNLENSLLSHLGPPTAPSKTTSLSNAFDNVESVIGSLDLSSAAPPIKSSSIFAGIASQLISFLFNIFFLTSLLEAKTIWKFI